MSEQPIPPEFIEKMKAVAHALDEVFNGPPTMGAKPRVGFVLLTADFDRIEGGRVNYISNGERASMVEMLREYLARLEGRYQDGGRA